MFDTIFGLFTGGGGIVGILGAVAAFIALLFGANRSGAKKERIKHELADKTEALEMRQKLEEAEKANENLKTAHGDELDKLLRDAKKRVTKPRSRKG